MKRHGLILLLFFITACSSPRGPQATYMIDNPEDFFNEKNYQLESVTVVLHDTVPEYPDSSELGAEIKALLSAELNQLNQRNASVKPLKMTVTIDYERFWSVSGAMISQKKSIYRVDHVAKVEIFNQANKVAEFEDRAAREFGGLGGYFKNIKSTIGLTDAEDEKVFVEAIARGIAEKVSLL